MRALTATIPTLLLSCLAMASAYEYSEIVRLNASCAPKDSCSAPRDLDHPEQHNCDCSSLCVLYDSCCIDSPFLNISGRYERPATCTPSGIHSESSVFMVDACPTSYGGAAAIRERCEGSDQEWTDPFNNLPVTHLQTQKTYKNIFCALCNEEDPDGIVMWKIHVDCSSLGGARNLCSDDVAFVLANMMYVRNEGFWGVWSYDPESDWKFRRLSLSYAMPDRLARSVRKCRPDLVSDCDSRWRDERVRELCQAYMGVVHFRRDQNASTAYRNAHCAACNFETDWRSMSCSSSETSSFKGGTAMNFGMLVDFDLSDGERVGRVDGPCAGSGNEVFDPFSKKCRKIECPLPGYRLKNRKCVPEKQ